MDKITVTKTKGLAILLIAFHNYFHHISKKTQENEMDFSPERFDYFLTDFIYSPTEWVPTLFTYFGHFGVQIFIFLSAYALSLSHNDSSPGVKFLVDRIKKLYPMFIGACLMWLVFSGVYQYGYRGPYWILANNFWQLLLVLTAIYPLVPGAWYPPVGPWWFIPFIMQFYLIWSLGNYLLAKIARPTLIGLTALSVSANFFIVPLVQNKYNINILFTPLGHLPEIFFGIFCARNGVPSAQYILPPAIILLLVSSYSAQFWPLHHISGLLVFLYLCIAIIKQAGQRNSQHFLWLGNYSLGIFLVNGFLREPFVDLSNYFNSWIISILLVVPFFALSCAMAVALTKIIHTIATKKRPKITNTPNAERDD